MPLNLAQVCDLLRPGLWGMTQGKGDRADLFVDWVTDSIGVRINGKPSVLFTRPEIEDGIHKVEFAPRVKRLLEEK